MELQSNESRVKRARKDGETEPEAISLLDALTEDVLVRIILKMNPDMMNAFQRTCRKAKRLTPTREQFEKLTLDRAAQRLLKRLGRLPQGMGKFLLGLLEKESAIMAGGYVLQCITGDTYADSDIDIFIPAIIKGSFTMDEIMAREPLLAEESRAMLERALEMNDSTSPFSKQAIVTLDKYQQLSRLENIFEIQAQGVKIQFLFAYGPHNGTAERDLMAYVEEQFDLNICKCTFDGRRVQSAHVLAQLRRVATLRDPIMKRMLALKKGYEEEYKHVMPAHCNVIRCLTLRTPIVEQRAQKYQGRGFKVLMDI